jgi:hypothetical protein
MYDSEHSAGPAQCPKCRSRKWNSSPVQKDYRIDYPLKPAPQFAGPVGGKRSELQTLINDMQDHSVVGMEVYTTPKRKFPMPPCPTCRLTLKDEGDWFVCENAKCRVKRVSAEVIEAQWENRGQ